MTVAGLFVLCAVLLLGTGFCLVFPGRPEMRVPGCLIMACGCMDAAAAALLSRYYVSAAVFLVNGLWWAVRGFRDWWNRRGRKAARVLGEKSRARIRKLAGALRDAGAPLPESAR